uniref:Exosome complex component CSL4 C-terminal domain-containing protein n=1 Tax=Octopus bimaculoides TaxID=37653 RepID=A0A0L8FLV0_OCTBM
MFAILPGNEYENKIAWKTTAVGKRTSEDSQDPSFSLITFRKKGQKLCQLTDDKCSGNGTYIRNGYIYSSLAGFLHTETTEDKTLVEVCTTKTENIVPSVDALVTAKITNVNPRFCKCSIMNVGKIRLRESFRGMIRKEDVKATEKDKVEMYQCFRPGDIIVAKVVSFSL